MTRERRMGADTTTVTAAAVPLAASHRLSYAREFAAHAAIAFVVLIFLFPGVFADREIIAPCYQMFDSAPWSLHKETLRSNQVRYQPAGEYIVQWLNWYTVAQKAWKDGEWPLWNPYQRFGVPLLANYQTAFFNPVRVFYSIFDVGIGGTIAILLKIYLCGLTAYIYARGVGFRIASAYVLSLSWMLSPLNITWMYWCSTDVAVWFPLQMLGVEELVRYRYRRGFYLLTISAALTLFAGHPETAFTMSLAAGLYFLLRLVFLSAGYRTRCRIAATAIGAWTVALLVTASQTIPFIEYLVNSSTLLVRTDDNTKYAIPAHSLVSMLVPRYFGVTHTLKDWFWNPGLINSNFTLALYPGMLAWLGITLFALRSVRAKVHKQRVLCSSAIAIAFFLIATNHSYTGQLSGAPLFRTLWRFWYFPPVAFHLALLGTTGLDGWLRIKPRLRQLIAPVLAVLLGSAAIGAVYVFIDKPAFASMAFDPQGQVIRELSWSLIIVSLGLALIALRMTRLGARYFTPALIVLLALDLSSVTRDIRPTCKSNALHIQTETFGLLRSRHDGGRAKCFTVEGSTIRDAFSSSFLPLYGVEDIVGYDGLCPLRFGNYTFTWLFNDTAARLLSVRYRVVKRGEQPDVPETRRDDLKRISSTEGVDVYEDSGALPRVRLYSAVSVADNPDKIVDMLWKSGVDVSATALVEAPLPESLPKEPGTDPGTARIIASTTNSVTVHVDAKTRGLLVLADQYYPGWTVQVDGKPKPLLPVFVLLRGVMVEEGPHQIVFVYAPYSFYIGLAISIVTLLCGALIAIRQLTCVPCGRLGRRFRPGLVGRPPQR